MTRSATPDDDLLNGAIRAHYEDITAVVRARGHSRADAAEIVHDLYVKLAENPDALQGKRSLRAFLARAAINLGIDRRRRSGLEQRLFSASEAEALAVAAETAAPDRGLEIEARLTLLRIAIGELPERRRSVFILHRLHGMDADAIAKRLRISRNMVERHLRRALLHCLKLALRARLTVPNPRAHPSL